MNELQAIVDAWERAESASKPTALATVISVEGSAYRRAGARMLIREDGTTIGSISAGCLEADVIERSRRVMHEKRSAIVQYDTRGNEDVVWGLGIGCNGIVRVLLESLNNEHATAAMRFIHECIEKRERGVIARSIRDSTPGTRINASVEIDWLCLSETDLNRPPNEQIEDSIRDI